SLARTASTTSESEAYAGSSRTRSRRLRRASARLGCENMRRVFYGMPMQPELVEPRLRGRFGRPYLWMDECDSTQERARGLPDGGGAAGDHQRSGRGRRGRSWQTPPGSGLLFSLALEPRTPPERLSSFSLVAAEAVATACLDRAQVRWPNDVVVG